MAFKQLATAFWFFVLLAAGSCSDGGGPAALDAQNAEVDALFADWDREDSPGCVVGVVKNGEFIYRRGYGMANLEYGVPWTADTASYIGSTSKQFTATAIFLLADKDALSLDDDVRAYVLEVPDYGSPITIRHLIHHTSGLRDYTALLTYAGRDLRRTFVSDEETLDLIHRQKRLDFPPGSQSAYSNSGYFLLRLTAERVSGQPFRTFLAEQAFQPLGMAHTQVQDSWNRIVPNRAQGYAFMEDGSVKKDRFALSVVGPSGVLTTINDLLLWDRNFYTPTVGNDWVLERLTTPGKLTNGDEIEEAGGLIVSTYKALKTVHHSGGAPGFKTQLLRFPEQRFSVAIFCNFFSGINITQTAYAISEIYLGDQMEAPAPQDASSAAERPPAPETYVTVAASELERLIGQYGRPESNDHLLVTIEDGVLIGALNVDDRFELAPLGADRFRIVGARDQYFQFELKDGQPSRAIYGTDTSPQTEEYVYVESVSAARAAKIAGRYHSEELDADYFIHYEEEALYLEMANDPDVWYPLRPLGVDIFQRGPWQIRVERDQSGDITGLTADYSVIKGVSFSRLP